MRRTWLFALVVLALGLLFVVPTATVYYTDWLWFRGLGYQGVFLRTLDAQGAVFAATFACVTVFLFANFRVAQRSLRRPQVVLATGPDGRAITLERSQVSALTAPVTVVLGLLFGLSAASDWLGWLNFLHGVPFGQRDPLFGRDVGFYVYRLPMWESVRAEALVVTVLALLGCGLLYLLSGSFVMEARPGLAGWPRFRLVPAARRHLSLLAALLFALMAWGAWLAMAQTLLTPANVIFGASYTDVHANLPFLRVAMVALTIGAGLSIWHGFSRRSWGVPAAIGLYVVVSVAGSLYAGFVQGFVVSPNESVKEQPFIRDNIAATRAAYDLERVDERQLSGDAELTPQEIANNAGTIENVRLWENQPLLQTFSQIQEIRTYYDFVSVDNDRYMIDGKYRQVMLSARELNTNSLPNHTFVNERLTFTHGYGLTLGPVNQVTTEGLPVLFIRDLPPVSTVNLRIDQPSIYYGELSSDYALVRTSTPEFDYPHGNDNVTTTYAGSGGVSIGSLFHRLLFAMRFGTTDILVTSQITHASRILFHRRIADRVRTLAPFLTYDGDPYPVVNNGKIYWIQDAYTTSANYPYSTPTPTANGDDINYIRNSVKVVIDAYNGSMTFYMAEPRDPLVLTLARIFPGLLKPLDEMPAGLRAHVRYPEDIFRVQASMFMTYHMTNPSVFYNKEDQWQLPVLDTAPNTSPMQPYYTIMKLPGEQKTEFVQILPFTPRSKDNLSAWMVARSDGSHYGHMLAFEFPKQKIVYGPRQIIGRINQDQIISPQISLWNQQGSEVIWGTPLVIPIEESLLYVRPLYLRSPEGKIPELKRVIVAYQSQIVMAETLTQALAQIFGNEVANALPTDRAPGAEAAAVQAPSTVPSEPEASTNETMAQLTTDMRTHFDRAVQAQRDGDWARYGEELARIDETIKRMQSLQK